jgi:hypothetical protein
MNEVDELEEYVEELVADYQAQGFEVYRQPPFMPDSGVDVLLKKGKRLIALQTKGRGSRGGSRPEDTFIVDEPDLGHAATLLREAESVIRPESPNAALLVAWAAAEGAMRAVGRREGIDTDVLLSATLVPELHRRGVLTEEEAEKLDHFRVLRNAVAHGYRAVEVPVQAVEQLVALARRLLGQPKRGSRALVSTFAGPDLTQVEELRTRVQAASQLLQEILGPSAGLVSVHWERAEDDRGRTVITLALSDFTGKAVATFAPEELHERQHLSQRLRRLWGDLLQSRAEKQRLDLMKLTPTEVG